jgi:hypothetical protein
MAERIEHISARAVIIGTTATATILGRTVSRCEQRVMTLASPAWLD